MVVARDVYDRSGRRLLTAGSSVLDKHIKIFRAWGVMSVMIAEPGPEVNELPNSDLPLNLTIRDQVEGELSRYFRLSNRRHPVMRTLFELCVDRVTRERMRKEVDEP